MAGPRDISPSTETSSCFIRRHFRFFTGSRSIATCWDWPTLELSKISNAYDRAMRRRHVVLDARTRLATFKQIYASTADLCQQHGAAFVLVYFPFQGQYEKAIIQQVMDDLAATRGIKTLDLMDTVKLANRARPAYFPHDIHFNEYGNQVVAKALLDYLVANNLLNSVVPQASKGNVAAAFTTRR